MKKKIALSFIGTGKYLNFLPNFYEGFSKNFAPECEKHFFVFTDGELKDLPDDITVISISEEAEITQDDYSANNWYKLMHSSFGGLKRFSVIKKIKDQLKSFDWYCFIDADVVCSEKIVHYNDFFNEEKDFFGAQHPCFDNLNYKNRQGPLPHDRNTSCLAHVSVEEEDDVYLQGCLWGGKIPKVFDLIEELDRRVQIDISKNILASSHDESYLNRYRIENKDKFHVLHPAYITPGDMSSSLFNYEPIIYHSPAYKRELLNS